MGQMQGAFIVQIAYAIVTWLIAALVIQYPHYDLIESGIKLKSDLIDYYIFFLVFLFGVQTAEDAHQGDQGMLLGALLRERRHDSRCRRHHQPRLPDPR